MVQCPHCSTTDVFYSALFRSWKCNGCESLFTLEMITERRGMDRPTPKKIKIEPALKLKAGEADRNGCILHLREKVGDTIYDIWGSPKGRSFSLAIPYTDLTGKTLSKHSSLENAKAAFEEVKNAQATNK